MYNGWQKLIWDLCEKGLMYEPTDSLFTGICIHFFINKYFLSCLTDETRHCQWVFHWWLAAVNKILWSIGTIWDGQKLHLVNMKILPPLNVINSICFFQKRMHLWVFCRQPHLLLKLAIWMIRLSHVREHGKSGKRSGYACVTLWFLFQRFEYKL